MKYKIGQWVIVRSPLKGDVDKRTGKGREKRIALIVDAFPEKRKYKLQMMTSKDKENSNWFFERNDGTIVSGRRHYCVNVYESMIIRRRFGLDLLDFDEEELAEIRKLIQPDLYNI